MPRSLADAVGALGQHVEFLALRQELDPHAGSGLAPGLVEEVMLEAAQAALGRSHQILHRRVALAHLGEHGLGGDAAIHHPDAPRLAVLRLDLGQEAAQRGLVGGVAGHDLVGERQAFRRHHQGDDDLDAVGALVAAIAEAALVVFVLRRIGFEIGAGQVVEQDVEAGVEEIAPAIDEMGEQRLLVGEQKVMAGVELVGLGEAEVTAEQIGERALAEPLAMQEPLAAGRDQPVGDQHEQDLLPARALAAGRQARGEEAVELQLLPQLSRRASRRPTGAGRRSSIRERRRRTTA